MITEVFDRFKRVIQTLAPPIQASWNPPASTEEIIAAQDKLGIEFPDELKELLRCAGGQPYPQIMCDPIFPSIRFRGGELGRTGYAWLAPLDRIVERGLLFRDEFKDIMVDVAAGAEVELIGPVSLHTNVIDLTETDGALTLCLDLSPEKGGKVGQVIHLSTQPLQVAVIANSLTSFILTVLDGYLSHRFHVKGKRFVWREDD